MEQPVTFNFNRENIVKMVLSTLPSDLAGYFEFLRYEQYKRIASSQSEIERLEVQQIVKGINLLESRLRVIREKKEFS